MLLARLRPQVLASDPNIGKGIDVARPYRLVNIYETFESTVIDVRVYCLKAVQVNCTWHRNV